jgi:hypothetical protein
MLEMKTVNRRQFVAKKTLLRIIQEYKLCWIRTGRAVSKGLKETQAATGSTAIHKIEKMPRDESCLLFPYALP